MQTVVKWSLWQTFKWNWAIAALFAIIGETTGVCACYFISFLINYLRDPLAHYSEGLKLVAAFVAISFVQ